MAHQSPPSVVVLGGINMDLVTMTIRFPEAGETVVGTRFLTYPGGKGANQAVAAARMGAAVAMVGRVGDDVFGPQLLKSLTDSGVDISAVDVAINTNSGLAIIEIDGSSQNRITQILGANDTCGPSQRQQVSKLLLGPGVSSRKNQAGKASRIMRLASLFDNRRGDDQVR